MPRPAAPSEVTDEMLDVQRKAQEAGKIRFRALSTHFPSRMLDFILNHARFDVVQIPYDFAIGTRRDPLYGTYEQPGAHGAAIRWALRDARV
jgi:predicted aldo/keto reductase-like oxidoreductase